MFRHANGSDVGARISSCQTVLADSEVVSLRCGDDGDHAVVRAAQRSIGCVSAKRVWCTTLYMRACDNLPTELPRGSSVRRQRDRQGSDSLRVGQI